MKKEREFKATILGIFHTKARVAAALPKFKVFLQPGKTLYVEFVEGNLEEALKGKPLLRELDNFDLLVEEAIKAGMNVIQLDSKKLYASFFERQHLPHAHEGFKDAIRIAREQEIDSNTRETLYVYYNMHEVRERKWMLKLRGVQEGDIVVVHSNHAQLMAEKFGIPLDKIVFFDKPDEKGLNMKRKLLEKENLEKFKELRKRLRELRKSRPR